ncbi:hypothetical protein SAMN00790413_06273 [Deinococcus hopiensis KR-140]|uniref:Uncharacterized protein n=1 Tax=Deinococcus hopiensis KR-140 TaxID=695939 RepID=A0A1W1VUF1_9DEIO|nr:hypothetical protein SAMN00790413_06273 [Deinococcus hopiensis KR-140]
MLLSSRTSRLPAPTFKAYTWVTQVQAHVDERPGAGHASVRITVDVEWAHPGSPGLRTARIEPPHLQRLPSLRLPVLRAQHGADVVHDSVALRRLAQEAALRIIHPGDRLKVRYEVRGREIAVLESGTRCDHRNLNKPSSAQVRSAIIVCLIGVCLLLLISAF